VLCQQRDHVDAQLVACRSSWQAHEQAEDVFGKDDIDPAGRTAKTSVLFATLSGSRRLA
jgi:hypothetical protein